MRSRGVFCLTCRGGVRLNQDVSALCRECRRGDQTLAVPLYCGECCLRENKCANCGSEIRLAPKR
jgi:hypothetical protein